MSQIKIAINGFGRIGRSAFKIACERDDLDIVAINDLIDTKTLAYLLKNDSNYGVYEKEVSHDDSHIIVDGHSITVLSERDPAALPWSELGVQLVIESTGVCATKEKASRHIQAGAKRVVLSCPPKSDDIDIIILGVNEDKIDETDEVISNASCTSNSVGAAMAVLDAEFGVQKALLSTIHSYTPSQALQDTAKKDLREGRNAAENIIPSTTGAASAVAMAMPQLKGKFDGLSYRVPTPVVSISDVTALLNSKVTVEEVNQAFKDAAAQPFYQGILAVSEEPLVSRDYIGNSNSGIVDLLLTRVVDGDLVKIAVWYDNEWGYANRLVELAVDVGRFIR